jgi:hypothetical protein
MIFSLILPPKNRLILITHKFMAKIYECEAILAGKKKVEKIITQLRKLVERSNFACRNIFTFYMLFPVVL